MQTFLWRVANNRNLLDQEARGRTLQLLGRVHGDTESKH